MPEEPPSLDELYEPDVLARIDAVLAEGHAGEDIEIEAMSPERRYFERGPVTSNGKVAEWARTSTIGALMMGYTRAIEEIFTADPEIAEFAEDPGSAARDDRPVRLLYVPDAPKASKAFVRPWLFARRAAAHDDTLS